MKQLATIILALCFFGVNAQEKQTRQEKEQQIKLDYQPPQSKKETKEERKKRYIEEVNPFSEYGYRPKIATLSNGKYRESFPDTIVQIGSFYYNRMSKNVIGMKTTKNMGVSESDLRPDLVSRWFSPDPLSDEFPSWSPYNFVKNNPIRYIDPEGLAPQDVIIKGGEKAAAFSELQSSVSSELTLSMDASGKVSYSQNGTGALSGDAQQLVSAIDDSSISVNIEAENTMFTKSGSLMIGGAFSGNTVTTNPSGNTVDATNEINPGVLGAVSTAHGKPGADVLHEVTESYQGAKIAQASGISTGPATGADISNPASVYNRAHNSATPQSGAISETLYNAAGRVIPMPASGVYPSTVRSVEWSVNNTAGTRVVIQTLK